MNILSRTKFNLLGGSCELSYKYLQPVLFAIPLLFAGGGYVDYGQRLTTGIGCRIEAFRMNDSKHKRIIFGNDVQINDYVHISSIEKVDIGNNVLMASHVYISDNSHGYYDGSHCDSSPQTPPKDRAY